MSNRSSGSCHSRETALAPGSCRSPAPPEQQNALRRGQADARASSCERYRAFGSASPEHRQAPTLRSPRWPHNTQEPAFADDLLFFGKNLIDILRRSTVRLEDDFGEHIFGPPASAEPAACSMPLPALIIKVQLNLFPVADSAMILSSLSPSLPSLLGKIMTVISLVQIRGFPLRRNQHDGLGAVFRCNAMS